MRTSRMSWGIAAVAIGVAAARLALVLTDPAEAGAVAGVRVPARDLVSVIAESLLVTSFAITGAILASQKPRNPIGWLLLTTGVSFGILLLSERLGWHYLLADGAITNRVAWWLWVADWVWIPAVVPIFIFIPLLFPTGRPPSPRWRFVLWAATFIVASLLVSAALAPGPLQNYVAVESPVGTAEALNVATVVLFAFAGLATLASVASLALRFRHSHGVEHQQIMWMWAAGALLVVSFVSSALLESAAPALAENIVFVGLLATPAAVTVAILRYRLYDIAVVVNRTLVYGSLTAALGLVYLAGVLLFQLVLAPVTEDSGLAVAISTLAVAGLFRPIRARIQRLVDRRFYRRKYDAELTLEAFSARLREDIDLDSLARELGAVVAETVQPAHVSLWLPHTAKRANTERL